MIYIRKKSNIIAYEKKAKVPDIETLSQDKIESLKSKLENRKSNLSSMCKAAQPTQDSSDHLNYRTETAKKFISVVNDKYTNCLRHKSLSKMLQKLQYTVKLAELKVKELEENMQDDDDDPEVLTKGSSKRKSF